MARTITDQRKACIEMVGDDTPLLFADGHDHAILGIADRSGVSLVVYDAHLIVETLRKRDRMSREEAEEFFEFNIGCAWVGDETPIFLRRLEL